jgi:hypothetical protein
MLSIYLWEAPGTEIPEIENMRSCHEEKNFQTQNVEWLVGQMTWFLLQSIA